MNTLDKVVKDGKVAILYSPGFGAGWYTWNRDCPQIIFDPEIVQAVLENDEDKDSIDLFHKVVEIAKRKYPNIYTGGAVDLRVQWLDEGDIFEIKECDGKESVRVIGRFLQA